MDRRSWLNRRVWLQGSALLGLCLSLVVGGALGAQDDRARRILELLEEQAGSKLEVAELLKDAENHIRNLEFLKAEEKLDVALRLDPTNAEAQRMMTRVRLTLGDRRGEIAQVQKEISDETEALIGQAKADVELLLSRGRRQEEDREYEKAIQSYESAIEVIRNFPFNLELGASLEYAKESLARAQRDLEEKRREDRRLFEEKVKEMKEARKIQSLVWEQDRIQELRTKAYQSLARGDYETTIANAQRILEAYPEDQEAARLRTMARDLEHLERRNRIFIDTVENYRLALLGIAESSIIYQQIFRYPDRKEWERITPKESEQIGARAVEAESEVEREIRRKLQELHTIGFPDPVPFDEAIALLRRLSGVNIILQRSAREAVEAEGLQVQLARVRDLPLENVLRLILRQSGDANFDFLIKEGAIVIGTRESLEENQILHFYEINDITQAHPDFPAPDLALDETEGQEPLGGGGFFDAGFEEEEATGAPEVEKLVELIEKELTDSEGRLVGSVSPQRGKLAVRTTMEYHEKVGKLLAEFRKATGIMVTVESRFLVLQDNFLEEIGIDIGSGNATNLLNSIPDIDGAGTSVSPGFEFVNAQQDMDVRASSIGTFSNPLGSRVNPFNVTSEGGGAYQLNVLTESYQLEALLTGVAKEQQIRRLSSPRVTAFNTQTAHTMVVNQAAYIKDLEVNQTGVIPVINPVIGVLNTGSILEVRPNVSHDRKYVVLEIQPTLAEQLDSDVALLNLSGNFTQVPVELPVTSVTKIKTTVTIPDGGTVLLGGLKRQVLNKSSLGVPGLRRIPVLNLLFGRRGESNLRSNLFVLINAKITIVQEEEERLFNI